MLSRFRQISENKATAKEEQIYVRLYMCVSVWEITRVFILLFKKCNSLKGYYGNKEKPSANKFNFTAITYTGKK